MIILLLVTIMKIHKYNDSTSTSTSTSTTATATATAAAGDPSGCPSPWHPASCCRAAWAGTGLR